jgi:dihydrofolate reductase
MVTIIVAYSSNYVIGNKGQLLWRLPSDLKRFKKMTLGHPVIMGRKTYDSLPRAVRPLPDRTNIVVTRNPELELPGCLMADSLEMAMALAAPEDCFVIGGEQIYRQALPLADRILVTHLQDRFEGDAYFPPFHGPESEWREAEGARDGPHFENDLLFTFRTYLRAA